MINSMVKNCIIRNSVKERQRTLENMVRLVDPATKIVEITEN
jgi:hypothetical protein